MSTAPAGPRGEALKIYVLMLLIGSIAAMSHLAPARESAKGKAGA
jgi:hypothetical protein